MKLGSVSVRAVGRLLPTAEDIDPDDAAMVAEAKMVLAEMEKVKSQIDAMLELERLGGPGLDQFERQPGRFVMTR